MLKQFTINANSVKMCEVNTCPDIITVRCLVNVYLEKKPFLFFQRRRRRHSIRFSFGTCIGRVFAMLINEICLNLPAKKRREKKTILVARKEAIFYGNNSVLCVPNVSG